MAKFKIKSNIYKAFPRVSDYIGAWAIEEQAFKLLKGICFQPDGTEKITEHLSKAVSQGYTAPEVDTIEGKIAVVNVSGVLMKHATSLTDGTSTVALRSQIKDLANDDSIDEIVMIIDSPGGTVSGTSDLADEVKKAAQKKRVVAYVEDTCCSAAYWIASQATEIYSNPTATIGSIGTFLVVEDSSKKNKNDGIETLVFSTGKYKGAGIPGSKVTDEQKKEFQNIVNDLNEHFLASVADGRKTNVKSIKTLATGQVWLASDAIKIGLIDGIKTFDDIISEIKNKMEVLQMEKETKKAEKIVKPASIAELKELCSKADSDFILSMAEKGLTSAQAIKEYSSYLSSKLDEKDKALEAKEEELKKVKIKKPGLSPVADSPSEKNDFQESDNPEEVFFSLVEKYEKRGLSKARAIAKAIDADPEAHKAYIESHSKKYGWGK